MLMATKKDSIQLIVAFIDQASILFTLPVPK